MDPLGHDYYYYYGEDQAETALVNIRNLQDSGEIVHPYYVRDKHDENFINSWNDADITASDSVIINMHGQPNGVSCMKMSKIESKTADMVYLLSCDAGDQYTSNNIAKQFFNANSFSALIGCDGTHFRGEPELQAKVRQTFWGIASELTMEYDKSYVDLSVKRILGQDDDGNPYLGPTLPSMGYVVYTRSSVKTSDGCTRSKTNVGSIGDHFKGINSLIDVATKYRDNVN